MTFPAPLIAKLNAEFARLDCSALDASQLECLNDPTRAAEAVEMVEDWQARVGIDAALCAEAETALRAFPIPGELTGEMPLNQTHAWQWADTLPRGARRSLREYLVSLGFVLGVHRITEEQSRIIGHALDHYSRATPWHPPVKLSDAFPGPGSFYLAGQKKHVTVAESLCAALAESGWIYNVKPETTYFEIINGRIYAKYQRIIGSRCLAIILPE